MGCAGWEGGLLVSKKVIFSKTLDALLIISTVVLTNATAFSFTLQFPAVDFWHGYAWIIVLLCLGVLVLMVLQMKIQSLMSAFGSAWKKQTFLILFLLFSVCSLVWSVYLEASLYKISVLLFASLMGVYLAVRYEVRGGLKIIRSAGVIFIFSSFALLLISEPFSRLLNYPYYGAWRGIFWHRNHLGSLMAYFSTLFVMQIVMLRGRWLAIRANAIYFLLAAVLVFGSRSAAGILLFFVLNFTVIVGLIWLQIRHLLTKAHYLAMFALVSLAVILIMINLDFIFGLVGRDTTMTGRTFIWADLLARVWPERPILGYGFGALWMIEAFRTSMQVRHNWPYQVFFGDNGFLDFLLNLGVVGFGLFMMYFVKVGINSVKALVRSGSFLSLLLPLTFLYVLLANTSFSFFLEIDQFVWMLLVMVSVWSAEPNRSLE